MVALVGPRLWAQGLNGYDNGIAVGRPKIYDNRSLEIMLQSLNASLQSLQFVNQSTVAGALGVLQGTESYNVSRNLSVNASFLPKTSPAPAGGSGGSNSGSSGSGSSSGSSGSGRSGSGSSGSGGGATPPATLPILTASSAQFGESSNDLLSDQVNLTYQAINLRMLLERSVTDRLLNGTTRLQAVIGFDVTLDPPRETKDSAAVIEVTIVPECRNPSDPNTPTKPCTSSDPHLSLVALMPQEKTYNSAALNTHSNAFGGSAVTQMVTVGYSESHSGQVFYLFRDNDTTSFERIGNNPDGSPEITFGWQFRPVLGRRSVSPGTRQMFAVLALPSSDELGDQIPVSLRVCVKKYWKHYDHRTLTTTYHERWVHFVDPSHIPDWPLKLPAAQEVTYGHVEVPTSSSLEASLHAVVDSIEWLPANNQNGTIVVHGKNFFSGTTVTLAGQVYATTADGLNLQSDQTMVIQTTVQTVATGDGVINGRYGKAIPLQPGSVASDPPIVAGAVEITPYGSEFSKLTATIRRENGLLTLANAPVSNAVFMLYNGTVLTDKPVTVDQGNSGTLTATAYVSNAVLGNLDGYVTCKFAFGGKRWESTLPVFHPDRPIITRTGGKDTSVLTLSMPKPNQNEFIGDWRVILDDVYPVDEPRSGPLPTFPPPPDVEVRRVTGCAGTNSSQTQAGCHTIVVKAKTTLLDSYQKMVLVAPDGTALTLAIPQSAPATLSPQLSKTNSLVMLLNDARAVKFYGQALAGIKRVFFNNADLPFVASGDGTSITVFISPDITSKSGHKDITFQVDPNTLLIGGIDVLQTGSGGGPQGANTTSTQKGSQQ